MGGAHPHALERNDAMRGLATGNREGKAVEREQTVHTPESILDVCREVFLGGEIMMDPCASRGHEFATHNWYEEDDGLSEGWMHGTYWNPPYKYLKALKPLKFKGYTQAFPAPLVLVYRGPNGDAFEGAVRGRNLACTVTGSL
jgi:hypothetical protein